MPYGIVRAAHLIRQGSSSVLRCQPPGPNERDAYDIRPPPRKLQDYKDEQRRGEQASNERIKNNLPVCPLTPGHVPPNVRVLPRRLKRAALMSRRDLPPVLLTPGSPCLPFKR